METKHFFPVVKDMKSPSNIYLHKIFLFIKYEGFLSNYIRDCFLYSNLKLFNIIEKELQYISNVFRRYYYDQSQ